VLVVDDDDDLRFLYRRVLTNRGYRVLEASSLEDAFEKLAQSPDAVVLDLELPDGKSTVLLDVLAVDRKAPPVVLCTTSESGARVARRYHIAALSKSALTAIADEIDRVIAAGVGPRVSRVSRTSGESRPSLG